MIGVLTNLASLVSGSVEFSILAKATVVLIAGLATAAVARTGACVDATPRARGDVRGAGGPARCRDCAAAADG